MGPDKTVFCGCCYQTLYAYDPILAVNWVDLLTYRQQNGVARFVETNLSAAQLECLRQLEELEYVTTHEEPPDLCVRLNGYYVMSDGCVTACKNCFPLPCEEEDEDDDDELFEELFDDE